MILNQSLDAAALPADVRAAFFRRQARKTLLSPGHALYKLTSHPLFKPDGTVTPWWFSVEPIVPEDPGLAGSAERARTADRSLTHFSRVRGAVTKQWNDMTRTLFARTLVPVYAFVGQASGQLVDADDAERRVFFIGGAWQLWIPGLTRMHVAPSPPPTGFPPPRLRPG